MHLWHIAKVAPIKSHSGACGAWNRYFRIVCYRRLWYYTLIVDIVCAGMINYASLDNLLSNWHNAAWKARYVPKQFYQNPKQIRCKFKINFSWFHQSPKFKNSPKNIFDILLSDLLLPGGIKKRYLVCIFSIFHCINSICSRYFFAVKPKPPIQHNGHELVVPFLCLFLHST